MPEVGPDNKRSFAAWRDGREAHGRGRVLTTLALGSLSRRVILSPDRRASHRKHPAGGRPCAARAASPPFRAGRIRSNPSHAGAEHLAQTGAHPIESIRPRRRRASGTTGRPPSGRFFCEKSPAGQWCAARAAVPPFRVAFLSVANALPADIVPRTQGSLIRATKCKGPGPAGGIAPHARRRRRGAVSPR